MSEAGLQAAEGDPGRRRPSVRFLRQPNRSGLGEAVVATEPTLDDVFLSLTGRSTTTDAATAGSGEAPTPERVLEEVA